MDIRAKIGERIRELRDKLNLSQKDLAYQADLDRSYIAGVEKGQRNISIVNIEKISNALNMNLNDFFNDAKFNS
ncbi:helix-turn-helix domain-containing protein [Hymenobacter rubripertinctus]|uniref:XRE family transcriptional regulator n=1 Tax=Hymenobacter rubripertinctus TaxID=2029981 RepID=A0A418R8Q4_9BACT|nr:helix-turn-helix transcriptional regulator [Hymenobacter rubripertinctus]RIY13759.1 XRE family transcriptional regulator [Hymenobacter rubripertinctus]